MTMDWFLPPRIAPTQIVILPITPKEETPRKSVGSVRQTRGPISRQTICRSCRSKWKWIERDLGGGVKNWEWIKKGVPIRIELGPRDLEKNSVVGEPTRSAGESEGIDVDRGICCYRVRRF